MGSCVWRKLSKAERKREIERSDWMVLDYVFISSKQKRRATILILTNFSQQFRTYSARQSPMTNMFEHWAVRTEHNVPLGHIIHVFIVTSIKLCKWVFKMTPMLSLPSWISFLCVSVDPYRRSFVGFCLYTARDTRVVLQYAFSMRCCSFTLWN